MIKPINDLFLHYQGELYGLVYVANRSNDKTDVYVFQTADGKYRAFDKKQFMNDFTIVNPEYMGDDFSFKDIDPEPLKTRKGTECYLLCEIVGDPEPKVIFDGIHLFTMTQKEYSHYR